MAKKSIVKSVQANGTWEGTYGVMYKYEVCFENGDCGEYSSKSDSQDKFKEGVETEYEFVDGKYPKVKPVSNFQQGGFSKPSTSNPEREKMIVKQSTLKCATDYIIANGGDEHRIIDIAEILTAWVMEDKKPTPKPDEMPF